MAADDHPNDDLSAANPGPFVVPYPCPACGGRGSAGERPCPACQGTGVGRFFHGTRAELAPGDLIEHGRSPNFGDLGRTTTWVYLTGTLDAAVWGAELALGDGPGRIYAVEPTGPLEDDPNLTDKKFPGNRTRSYRTHEPLRVTGEVTGWQGHTPEQLEAMREGLALLRREGVEPIE